MTWAAMFLAERAAPQSPQNRLPGGLSPPHLGQGFASGAQQSPQNLAASEFSDWQLGQRIPPPSELCTWRR
jgi:hypothetical protein